MLMKNKDLETMLAHGVHHPDSDTRSLTSPIYQTATYAATSQENFEDLCYNWGHKSSKLSCEVAA